MRNSHAALLLIVVSAAFMGYSSQHKAKADLTDCQANLKTLATACDFYSIEHGGRYPQNLDQLAPHLLKSVLPCCPTTATQYEFQSSETPYAFTLYCMGANHIQAGQAANFPQFCYKDDGRFGR